MIGSDREALPDDWEWSETLPNVRKALMDIQERLDGHPRSAGVVGRHSRMFLRAGRPSRMSRSVWEALLDVREWSGGLPGFPEVFGRPSRMSECGRETLPDVQKALTDARDCLEGPLGCPRVVGRPSRMSGSGWEALPDVRECPGGPPDVRELSENPPGCPGGPLECPGGPLGCPGSLGGLLEVREWLGGFSRMFKSGRDAFLAVRDWSGVSPECSVVVVRPFQMSESGRLALPDVRECSGGPWDVRQW